MSRNEYLWFPVLFVVYWIVRIVPVLTLFVVVGFITAWLTCIYKDSPEQSISTFEDNAYQEAMKNGFKQNETVAVTTNTRKEDYPFSYNFERVKTINIKTR